MSDIRVRSLWMLPPLTRLAAALAIGAFATSHVASAPSQRTSTVKALVGGTLVDGFGGRPIRNSVVLIEGERISAVGQVGALAVPAGAEVISTEGMSVLPGLWDMHVHLMINGHSDYAHWDKTYPAQFEPVIMPASAKQLLLAGVTSARDLGGPLEASIAVRNRINSGRIPGATVYVSGPFIQKAPYPGTEAFRWGVSGADDARAKVRRLADAGVNVIKLIDQDQMTLDELSAVVGEAHQRGLPVVAHAHRPEEIRRGLGAGVDCFEHTGLASAPEYPAGRHRRHPRANGEDEPRPALLDADDRRPAQLRVPAGQSSRRSTIPRGTRGSRRRLSLTSANPSSTRTVCRTFSSRPLDGRRWRGSSGS